MDAILQEGEVETEVDVAGLLPLQVGVRSRLSRDNGLYTAWQNGSLLEGTNEIGRGVLIDITLNTIRSTERELAKPLDIAQELLLLGTPQTTDRVEGQIAILLGYTKDIATIEADTGTQRIAIEQGVRTSGKPRDIGILQMGLLVEGILAGNILGGEEHRLRGERTSIVAIGCRGKRLSLGMAHLGTCHQLYIVDVGQTAIPLEHGLPRPLIGVRLCLASHTTIGENGLIYAIDGIAGILLGLAHGIALLTSIAIDGIVVVLITKLGGELQILVKLELGIEDSHHRAVDALLGGVGVLLEDIKVGSLVLASLYVVVVVISSIRIVGLEVWIGTT